MRRPTIEAKLERDVQEQFEKGLSDFIREKAEAESLYDHEIADILGANPNWIRQYRRRFGIRMGKRFPRRFENIHGKDAVERFKKIIEDPDSSLVDVARRFGFTREYARQVYQSIYGFPYTHTLQKKRELRDTRRLKQKLRRLTKAAERMESRGIDFEVADLKRKLLVTRNGHRISVRICSKLYAKGANRYFRFKHTSSGAGIDFFLCVCKDFEDDVCFVIPSNEMPERLSISLIPDSTLDQSEYAQFREAWHLLEPMR